MTQNSWKMLTKILLFAIALSACTSEKESTNFELKGWSKEAVLKRHGKPAMTTVFVKSTPHMFGPIESYWHSIPDGASVEIWNYPVRGGTVQLYFLLPSQDVWETSFVGEGVVF